MTKKLLPLLLACSGAFAQTMPPADLANVPVSPAPASTTLRPLTLEDLYSELDVVDVAISPSGRHLAAVVRRGANDLLLVMDLATREHKVIQSTREDSSGKLLVVRMANVHWKSDDRLIFRLRVRTVPGFHGGLPAGTVAKLGDRLYAVNRDGSDAIALLGDNRNRALNGALNLGRVASFLPNDPTHILLVVDGFDGMSLFKVDLATGRGEQFERPGGSIVGWWLDIAGNPVVRMTSSSGTVTLFRKKDDKWVKFLKMRASEMRERADYELVSPSDQAGKYYVLARPPGHDRTGLYLYDLDKETYSDAIVEHGEYDLESARISRDGKRVISYCYVSHVLVCEFSDARLNSHMKGLRKLFEDSANLQVRDSSEDGNSFVLYVDSPRDPPAYYYYVTESKRIETVGPVQKAMTQVQLPRASVVNYAARDGKQLSGYLTVPARAPKDTPLALVIFPHGGPERRDSLAFDAWVQYFAARGYAVIQPNFRGSDGFGKTFAESGYGQWGRKMQDDITDAVKTLVDQGVADPKRVCIVGASYGGYAALAGAALTPDLYKCVVSVAGISDLDDFIGWRKQAWGRESPGYTYWLKAIGNPETDQQKLREVSPLQLISQIKAPVLLVHGTDDFIVSIAQSRTMKRLLDQAGHKTPLIELEHEGHSYWSKENEMYALSNIGAFLWQHLGAGFGVSTPPESRAKPD